MFNIGGQGQYFIGLIVANWLGYQFAGMATLPHILIAVIGATLAGAAWAGIAGVMKATVGAHEVITTIMLNWIALWVGEWLFGDGGPLQNSADKTVPISNDIAESARLPVFWGEQQLQGLHIGFFVALGALVVFSLVLNRTTLGFEVRAVGFNPEAAAYCGNQRAQEPDPRDGDLGRVRRSRGRTRHARLPVPLRPVRRPGLAGRLPRDRGRAARAQHRRRRRHLRAPVRRAPVRDDARPVVRRDPAASSPET